MSKSIISEGKTKQEAIDKGLKMIKLPKELCEIKVIEDNKKSFFDILAPRLVKVEIKEIEAKKPEQIEIETTDEELHVAKTEVEEFLKEFLEKAKIEAETKVEIKEKCLYVSINGKNVGNLIGYRGDALYALENILKAIANKESENRVIVRLDIENYKQKMENKGYLDKYDIENTDISEIRKIIAIRYLISQKGYSSTRAVTISEDRNSS